MGLTTVEATPTHHKCKGKGCHTPYKLYVGCSSLFLRSLSCGRIYQYWRVGDAWPVPHHSQSHSTASAAWLVLISHPNEAKRLRWPDWLVYQRTVTHLSTNRAQHRVILLTSSMPLPLGQTATSYHGLKHLHEHLLSRVLNSSSSPRQMLSTSNKLSWEAGVVNVTARLIPAVNYLI